MSEDTNHLLDADNLNSDDIFALSWGFYWRLIVYSVISALVGAVAGGMIGAVAGFSIAISGGDVKNYTAVLQLLGAVAGVFLGFHLIRHYIRSLFKAQFGTLKIGVYRLTPEQLSAA